MDRMTGRDGKGGKTGQGGGRTGPREPMSPNIPDSLTQARMPDDDLSDGGVYLALDFSGLDLSARSAEGAEFEECLLSEVRLSEGKLRRSTFRDVIFDRCDLANMRARNCQLNRAKISACRLTGFSWLDGVIRDTEFRDCRADLAFFRATKFTDVVFSGCRMEQADFGDCDLRGASFSSCDLTGAQFSGAQMTGTRFSDCELANVGGVTSFRGCVIKAADVLSLTFTLATALGITIEDD